MPTTTAADRWAVIRELQALMTGGLGDREAMLAFERGRRERGEKPVPRSTLHRHLKRAHAEWDKEHDKPHKRWRSRAIAARMRAMRLALTAQKIMVVDGKVEKHAEANIEAYLRASAELDALVGLDTPEGRELKALQARRLTMIVVEVLRDVVDDLPTRSRIVAALRERVVREVLEGGHRDLLLEADDGAGAVVDGGFTPSLPAETNGYLPHEGNGST